MEQVLPIALLELVDLPSCGIDPDDISFANLTLSSEHGICIRQAAQGAICVIDAGVTPPKINRHKITGDSAILHPTLPLIAVRGQRTLQVFNLEQKALLSQVEADKPVVFWKWASPNLIAYVTDQGHVYHWPVPGSQVVRVFEQQAEMREYQIVNYLITNHVDESKQWSVLVGLTARDGKIVGLLQLYSQEKRTSRLISAYSASIAAYDKNCSLLCLTFRVEHLFKMTVTPLGQPETQPAFGNITKDLYFPPETVELDFPFGVQVSDRFKVIYLITKFGYFHLYDLYTGTLIFMSRISADTVLSTAPKLEDGGMMFVNKKGQVLSVKLDASDAVKYILQNLNDSQLATQFMTRNFQGLSVSTVNSLKKDFAKPFEDMLATGKLLEAAAYAADTPALRTQETVERLKSVSIIGQEPSPVLRYYTLLGNKGKLSAPESLAAVKYAISVGKSDQVATWLKENKLECTEEMGDSVQDARMAQSIYLRADAKAKFIGCLLRGKEFEKADVYMQQTNFRVPLISSFVELLETEPQAALIMATTFLMKDKFTPVLPILKVLDYMEEKRMINECTTLLMSVLRNTPDEEELQTRLLEINLRAGPYGSQVANGILNNGMLTQFNDKRVADLCEQAGLAAHAERLRSRIAQGSIYEEELQKLATVHKSGFMATSEYERRKKEIEQRRNAAAAAKAQKSSGNNTKTRRSTRQNDSSSDSDEDARRPSAQGGSRPGGAGAKPRQPGYGQTSGGGARGTSRPTGGRGH